MARLAQLCQKTNQFNLTLRRHHQTDLIRLGSSPQAYIAWLSLQDRFGSYGIVGCGVVRVEGDTAMIDTFLLSCRALGRQVEAVLASHLARSARDLGARRIVGEYVPGERNSQVADLYPRLGFSGLSGEKGWSWDLSAGDPSVPDWFLVLEAGARP
jgi:FkbH-like protein